MKSKTKPQYAKNRWQEIPVWSTASVEICKCALDRQYSARTTI